MTFGFWQVLLIVALVFILFGSQKFPSVMKNLAEGINIFKKEIGVKGCKEKPAPAPANAAKKKKPAKKPAKKK
jgi:TatA/E family protein of Tat protein translocase